MITVLLELVQKLVQEYKKYGIDFLINSASLPEFKQLVEHLAGITLKHVGITDDNHKDFFKKETTTYFNIMEEEDFCIGVFCLPAGSSLNLHDHPNMMVVSKFLMGCVYHRSLDLVDRTQQVELPKQLLQDEYVDVVGTKLEATVRSERILKAGDINYLTPDRGNIHKFTALENTAILDILLPNYNETDHYCNYYIEVPIGKEGAECADWEEIALGYDEANKNMHDELVKYESSIVNKKRDMYTDGFAACKTDINLKPVGEKTTLIYILPPLNEPITLVPYTGETFKYQPLNPLKQE